MRYSQMLCPLLLLWLPFFLQAQSPPCDSLRNLALDGTATQSSTNPGGDAEQAIDGNTQGDFYHPDQSVSSTQYGNQMWWRVDLGQVKSVNNVRIWNQTNGNSTADFYVFYSSAPLSDDLNTNLNDANVDHAYIAGDAESPSVFVFLENQPIRYLQIQGSTWGFVTLAEVDIRGCDLTSSGEDSTPPSVTISTPLTVVDSIFELNVIFSEAVTDFDIDDLDLGNAMAIGFTGGPIGYTVQVDPIGSPVLLSVMASSCTDYSGNGNLTSNELELLYNDPASAPVNVALQKTATQSSSQGPLGTASNAVDGNTQGDYYHPDQSVSSTDYQEDQWWEVDLDSIYDLATIQLYNQTNGNSTNNFYVFASDVPFTATDINATINQSGVTHFYTAGAMGSPTTLSLNRTARYIRVQTDGWGFTTLAEFEAYPNRPTRGGPDINTYHQPRKKLDGSFVTIPNRTIFLKYIEDYAIATGVNDKLRVKIYDTAYRLRTSSTLTNHYGVNWFRIRPRYLLPDEYYILELTGGNKEEKYYLRFIYED